MRRSRTSFVCRRNCYDQNIRYPGPRLRQRGAAGADAEEREEEIRQNGVASFTGLPVTTAALVFPMVLLMHYVPQIDLTIPYFVVMLAMAVLFLGRFKIRKPGRKGVWIMVAIGFAEFVAFMILMRVTKV